MELDTQPQLEWENDEVSKTTTENGAVNKSQAIRDYIATHPDAEASEIVFALDAKGIKVAPGLVYMIRGRLNRDGGAAPKRQPRTRVQQTTTQVAVPAGINLDALRQLKALATSVGGWEHLKEAVELLSE